ncbi:MAG: GNAT family N-acetyltransferase [Pseudomonadota bacterium]
MQPGPQPQPTISFRIITNADDDLLYRVFAESRDAEMAQVSWPEEEKRAFLKRQYDMQSQHYAQAFIGAVHRIIQIGDLDIGRLIVNRADDHLRIIDISLLPEWRGRGIGTDLLRSLMNEAHGGKVPVRLSVLKDSPALRLYQRHSFRPTEDRGLYIEMEWSPV